VLRQQLATNSETACRPATTPSDPRRTPGAWWRASGRPTPSRTRARRPRPPGPTAQRHRGIGFLRQKPTPTLPATTSATTSTLRPERREAAGPLQTVQWPRNNSQENSQLSSCPRQRRPEPRQRYFGTGATAEPAGPGPTRLDIAVGNNRGHLG
jgi:hypothetical protein